MSERKPKANPAEQSKVQHRPASEVSATMSQANASIDTSRTGQPMASSSSGPVETPVPKVFGRYKIEKELGKGAMGVVYLAEDTQLGRKVALKIPKKSVLEEPDALERFYREAKTTSQIRHPNICPVFDVGAIDGVHYLTMAYIPGKPVNSFLGKGKLPPARQVALLIRKIAQALDEAHKQGVVHRDLKPSNVMLDDRGEPIVMDFGLACQMNNVENARLTQSGAILGTPAYMAPEQVRGELAQIGPQSDIYALGVMLYQFLTGELPFSGPIMMVFAQILTNPPKKPSEIKPDVDPALEAICLKMIAKELGQRYASMKEVAAALTEYVKKGSVTGLEPAANLASTIPPTPTVVVEPEPNFENLPAFPSFEESPRKRRSKMQAKPPAIDVAGWWKGARKQPWFLPVAGALGALPVIALFAVVLYVQLGKATVQIEIDDPSLKVSFAKQELTIENNGEPITVRPGEQTLLVSRDGFETKTKSFTLKRGDKKQLTVTLVEGEIQLVDTADRERLAGAAVPQPSTFDSQPPPPAVAPFDAEQAKAHQAAWAKHLGVPVEYTNSLGMKFRLIPPGEFLMGSTPAEIEIQTVSPAAGWEESARLGWNEQMRSEGPQHKVILTKPIYLGINEVTQADYEQVMGKNPSHFSPTGAGKGDVTGKDTSSHPVETVSWNDAAEFCAKLSRRETLQPFYVREGETVTLLDGTGYRLPTEAEWEFACRAGTTTMYWIGDGVENAVAVGWANWFRTNGEFGRGTHAVGMLQANPFGFYDIHGNVWEWVQDWYEPSYYGEFAEKAAINPTGPSSAGSRRVARGGSWSNYSAGCRSVHRGHNDATKRSEYIGFRVSMTVDAVKQALGNSTSSPAETAKVANKSRGTPDIAPEPLTLKPGDPISGRALVRQPKPLPGLRSWTIDTAPNRMGISSLAFRPDSRQLATGGGDGTIRIWEPGNDRPLRVLLGHEGEENMAVAWSPDGKYLASCSPDQTLRFWNPESGRLLRTIKTPFGGRAIAWSPDGQSVAAGGADADASVWDVASGQEGKTFPVPGKLGELRSLAWSPDGKLLAGGFDAGNVIVWDATSGQALHNLTCKETRGVSYLVFAPDGRHLAAGGGPNSGKSVHVWEIPSGKLAAKLDHDQWISALGWSPDSQQLITTTGGDHQARFWDPSSGKVVRTVSVFFGLPGVVSPDGKLRAASWMYGSIYYTDLETGQNRVVPCNDQSRAAATWSPTGDRLALQHNVSGCTTIWEAGSGRLLRRISHPRQGYWAVAWSPTGNSLAVTNELDPQVTLWNPDTGDKLATLEGHTAGNHAVAWSRDGRFLATGSWDKTVRTWEAATGKPLMTCTGHTDTINAVAWSADGQTVASASRDQTVRLWDTATGQPRHVLNEHKSAMRSLAWSPDDKTLVSYAGETAPALIWWDVAEGRVRHKVPGLLVHGNLALSADGKTLATPYQLFNGETGEVLRDLQLVPLQHTTLSFSPDGKTLLANTSGGVQVVDVASGKPRGILLGLPEDGHLALTVDGHWRGSPGVEKQLVYIAVTDNGQETLTYEEFSRKYGWKNDPEAVWLGGAADPAEPSVPADAQTHNSHRYKFYPEQLSWKDAKAKCEALGGHLIIINNLDENAFAGKLVAESGWVDSWIGATDEAKEGEWKTVLGDPLPFVNWFKNQPNNKPPGEHYALMSNTKSGNEFVGWKWCDQPNVVLPVHKPGYLCEWDDAATDNAAATDGWIDLFNGKDLSNWVTVEGKFPGWKVENGYVEVVPGAKSIMTGDKYPLDFELHVEFWLPKDLPQNAPNANSGVYLLGRHEIQIYDSFSHALANPKQVCGSLWNEIAATGNAWTPPETWQTFDITLRSPRVNKQKKVTTPGRLTVIHNGKTVIGDARFSTSTNKGSQNDDIGQPGPIMLQDGGLKVRFRNLRIRPAKN